MRSLTPACSLRSRFTVVETSPVNERTFQSCSCNILVFTRETCTGKESFEQARISTYPEVCLQNDSRNLTRISRHFLETQGSPGNPGRLKDRKRHGTGDKRREILYMEHKFPLRRSNRENGTTFWAVPLSWEFSSQVNRKNVFHLAPNRNFWSNGKRPCMGESQRRLPTRRTALWVNIKICFSLRDLSCCSDLWRGDRRYVRIGIFEYCVNICRICIIARNYSSGTLSFVLVNRWISTV